MGRHIYDLDVRAEVVEINKAEAAHETYEHVTFRFFTKTRKHETGAKLPTSAKPAICAGGANDITLTYPPSTIVGAKDFCNIFPFHVAFNKNLELVQCGTKVQVRLLPVGVLARRQVAVTSLTSFVFLCSR